MKLTFMMIDGNTFQTTSDNEGFISNIMMGIQTNKFVSITEPGVAPQIVINVGNVVNILLTGMSHQKRGED